MAGSSKLLPSWMRMSGGGLPGNTARVLSGGLRADFDYGAWERPPLFRLTQGSHRRYCLDKAEKVRVFHGFGDPVITWKGTDYKIAREQVIAPSR